MFEKVPSCALPERPQLTRSYTSHGFPSVAVGFPVLHRGKQVPAPCTTSMLIVLIKREPFETSGDQQLAVFTFTK